MNGVGQGLPGMGTFPLVRVLWDSREALPIGEEPAVGFDSGSAFNVVERVVTPGRDQAGHFCEIEEAIVHHRRGLPVGKGGVAGAGTMAGFTDTQVAWDAPRCRLGFVYEPREIRVAGGLPAIESRVALVMVPTRDDELGRSVRAALLEHAADVAWHEETADRVLTSVGGKA